MHDVIGIDEGQFFPDLIEFTEALTAQGKTIIVAGLDGTFQRQPFGRILELVAQCESITKLSAICTETGNEACFTQRKIDSQELEIIGGAELYAAASRTSFFGRQIKGEVHVTIGPVQSGKTTELMRVLNRHQIANRKVLLVVHSEQPMKVTPAYRVMATTELPKIDEMQGYDIIGVDNGEKFAGIAEWEIGRAHV
jgi:thymidine kinase